MADVNICVDAAVFVLIYHPYEDTLLVGCRPSVDSRKFREGGEWARSQTIVVYRWEEEIAASVSVSECFATRSVCVTAGKAFYIMLRPGES